MPGLYLLALLLSLAGIAALDRRHRLYLWAAPIRASITLGSGLAFFISWDVWGIAGHSFYRGESPHLIGLNLGPEFPIEELGFLTLLCYTTMVLYT